MEVDMHMQSPPSTFRSIPFTIKRPRSPGSPPQERQTKRLSLAPVGLEAHGGRRASTASDGVADRRMASQDDWVQQARELSIASPLSVTAGFLPAIDGAAVAQSRLDEHMAVDDDDTPALRVHVHSGSARSWTTRSHLPPIQITTATTTTAAATPLGLAGLHAPSPASFSVLTEPPSSSSDSASSTSSLSVTRPCAGGGAARATHLRPPDIFLFPATPSDGLHDVGEGTHEGEGLLQSTLVRPLLQDRGDGRAGSPRPTRAGDMPTASGRKHRVTMGPRADCVKCRTGVRGHWMHFD